MEILRLVNQAVKIIFLKFLSHLCLDKGVRNVKPRCGVQKFDRVEAHFCYVDFLVSRLQNIHTHARGFA